jgi:hypothetical protein
MAVGERPREHLPDTGGGLDLRGERRVRGPAIARDRMRQEEREPRRHGVPHLGREPLHDGRNRVRAANECQDPDVEQPPQRVARIHLVHLPTWPDGGLQVAVKDVGSPRQPAGERREGIDDLEPVDQGARGRGLPRDHTAVAQEQQCVGVVGIQFERCLEIVHSLLDAPARVVDQPT